MAPIDYSKFDAISDSEDDKPSSSKPVKDCKSCGVEVSKPMACSKCKKAVYCSVDCQRSDWPFHKRLCTTNPTASPAVESPLPPRETVAPSQSRADMKSEVVVEDEEKLDWYRHREWKPSVAVCTDSFVPKPISEPLPVCVDSSVSKAKSAWNAADTWEERDVLPQVKEWLSMEIPKIDESMISGNLSEIEGFATITNIRGKIKYLFDLSFNFEIKFNKSIIVKISDFSSCMTSPPEVAIHKGADKASTTVKSFTKDKSFINALNQKQNSLVEFLSTL